MEKLLAKKKVMKSNITRAENAVDKLTSGDTSGALVHQKRVQLMLDEVYKLLVDFSIALNTEEYTAHEDDLGEAQDRLTTLLVKIHEVGSEKYEISSSKSDIGSEVRLPKLQLPVFGGSLQDWIPFRDLFESAVHNNKNLSGAQKLQYLKGLLQGDAALLLKSVPISSANYLEAWNILTTRYENKRKLVDATLKRLFSQPTIQQESVSMLRRMLDSVVECTRLLKVLGQPVEHWDAVLVFVVTEKLDSDSRRDWQLSLTSNDVPTFEKLVQFLEHRTRALSAATSLKPKSVVGTTNRIQTSRNISVLYGSTQEHTCVKCTGIHALYKCPEFLAASVQERYAFVKNKWLCFNCLSSTHMSRQCNSSKCRVCQGHHNTLLHEEPVSEDVTELTQGEVSSHHSVQSFPSKVLLSTALVQVQDCRGHLITCRALLDSGSEASFITEDCVQLLGLKKQQLNVTVSGLASNSIGKVSSLVQLNLQPNTGGTSHLCVNALVMSKLTSCLPRESIIPRASWSHIKGLRLADPMYNIPRKVDILLGGDIFPLLLKSGRCTGEKGSPVAIETELGWVLSGSIHSGSFPSSLTSLHIHCDDVNKALHKFWELEEVPFASTLTEEESLCEHHFDANHKRREDGRYVVRLPFREGKLELGESRSMAVSRMCRIEHQLQQQPTKHKQYVEFMDEYIALGHMEPIPPNELPKPNRDMCYIPHIPVYKESSTTTKLRVVFDASTKTSSGVSLNDGMMVGPKLQEDLWFLLIRFRKHIVPLVADIAKMYRQIWVHTQDTEFQRIVWRPSRTEPIQDYRLLTVTYGENCAPYLAIRCLKQLAKDEQDNFPLAAPILMSDFYVDDLLSGANSIPEALELQEQLRSLLSRGGFQLRQWASSASEIIEAVPVELRNSAVSWDFNEDSSVKTLGLQWHPTQDQFAFSCSSKPKETISKRLILSEISKLFDPLGWLSPVTVRAKILLQSLWGLSLDWDDPLPEKLCIIWNQFIKELPLLDVFRIDRCLLLPNPDKCELIGFCDASEMAYAAVVYLRSHYHDGTVLVRLVTGKTKVAPIKQISIPRLELCGALLLSKLLTSVQHALSLEEIHIQAWTDSTIVLAWLASSPRHWKTFVANRVAIIQSLVPSDQWFHVSGDDNPADCASRGLLPSELSSHPLWGSGPPWLQNPGPLRASVRIEPEQPLMEQERRVTVLNVCIHPENALLNRWSSLSKLQRVTAWCLRFVNNCRKPQNDRLLNSLTVSELQVALFRWVIIVQKESFSSDIHCLTNARPLSSKSRLASLAPFLDKNGVVRVGGRIQKSCVPEEQKHPVVLPGHGQLTKLVVMHEHVVNLHAGPQLVQAALQQRFWILRARDTIRHILKACVTCCRQRATTATQMMADLPAPRVRVSRPFFHCGVDYAGPFQLRNNCKGRSKTKFKGYVALFVCFSTKAIHIELVSDLTTSAFMAALKRFIARRGRPLEIFSDCGTNFVGAARELKELFVMVQSQELQQTVCNYLAGQGISWRFNPPAAPHQGGLWEAGVKSMKHHLYRVVGSASLTFEEFYTVLTMIEACLNSRPLTALSSDPSDLSALTPGHFLIGDSLLALPHLEEPDVKLNNVARWKMVQRIVQHFWKRWSSEYLSRLQNRPKWWTKQANLQIGDMVILKEEHMPVHLWRLGRITNIFPGSDNCVRTVAVQTVSGEVKRPVVKIVPLPF